MTGRPTTKFCSPFSDTNLATSLRGPGWFCIRYIQSQLYETKGMNLTVLAVATLTLTAAAGLIPALRASSTSPSQALRTE
jgi:ABC-type lipoprotein release transport system permease subunit